MKKAFILFFLSLFTYGAIYADVTWKLSDDGILTISGTKMDDYQYNDAPWSFQSGKIEKVVIEEGVTNIGNDAYSDCRSLTSVTIPNTVVICFLSQFQILLQVLVLRRSHIAKVLHLSQSRNLLRILSLELLQIVQT